MYNLTRALKEEGAPLDYVGVQSHIDLGWLDFEGYVDSVATYSQGVKRLPFG